MDQLATVESTIQELEATVIHRYSALTVLQISRFIAGTVNAVLLPTVGYTKSLKSPH